jgi:hypothetical protein
MAIYQPYAVGITLVGDGTSTSYSFTPAGSSGVLGLPTSQALAVLSATFEDGPTTPTVSASVLLGVVTITFSSALQAVNSDVTNRYNVNLVLGY